MIKAEFRYRARTSQSVQERHAEALSRLQDISWLWNSSPDQAELSSGDESRASYLNPYLKNGVSGSIAYSPRYPNGMRDEAIFDDALILDFDEDEIHYAEFSGLIFEEIVKAFSAYRAAIILGRDLYSSDYERIVELSQNTGKDIDGRDTVYRLNPVNYFDDQLCHRAFGFGAEEVVARLDGEVERASIQDSGALVIATTDLVDQENLDALHNHIAGLLGVESIS